MSLLNRGEKYSIDSKFLLVYSAVKKIYAPALLTSACRLSSSLLFAFASPHFSPPYHQQLSHSWIVSSCRSDCITQVLMHIHVCPCACAIWAHKWHTNKTGSDATKDCSMVPPVAKKTPLKDDTQWCDAYWIYFHVYIGRMEDGTTLGDVELPPWAKGDPQEFIRVHREVSDPRPHQAYPFWLASPACYIPGLLPLDLIMFANTSWCIYTEDALF